jgi:deazaflavin-dependent oxidoreductase (nitroreductase family)
MTEVRIDPNTGLNELEALPVDVQAILDAHKLQYQTDPANARMWDPIVMGVPGGPVKCLLLTYTGRKSGRTLQTVLQYYELGDMIAVAGTRGGTAEHPDWYLNLVTTPQCHIQIGKDGRDATARTLSDEDRAKWWPAICDEQPEYRVYEKRTTRQIPVVVFD